MLTMTKPAPLLWSERGAVTCADHAPYKGSDTWRWERWQRVPRSPETAHLVCETCRIRTERRPAA